ncbi:CEI_1a_G0004760.mRNA.1.CDS.1 [Saccharomyces cerevisiae]|nr:AMH_1a_G0000920.mRNA.1.CDS.1 [Saccharomyces cerevisiae]CAI4291734.1 CEI_1a_G0004760.mRNA.1.CDS.1 [Saccharomyces cerevisiae]CAI6473918.1 AMH_1a_G0000920.mRNA.1.CDS.1 [Saccharomyces cerevisiae]CAI7160353.1 CEI_1a_G0004760.mRNA.1.CDS.1 [Saccharomyces cerevisiae]
MIVNNTHVLTLPLYTTSHAIRTFTCILISHPTVYHLNLPYSPISHHQYKRTNIIINGTCLSGLYPVPFTHKAHDYPHFNIYISFGGPKYCMTALNSTRYTTFTPYTNHSIYIHLCQYYRKITTEIT